MGAISLVLEGTLGAERLVAPVDDVGVRLFRTTNASLAGLHGAVSVGCGGADAFLLNLHPVVVKATLFVVVVVATLGGAVTEAGTTSAATTSGCCTLRGETLSGETLGGCRKVFVGGGRLLLCT